MRENRVSRVVRLDQGQYDNHNPQLLDPITAVSGTACFYYRLYQCPTSRLQNGYICIVKLAIGFS